MSSIYAIERIQHTPTSASESTKAFYSTLKSANRAARNLVREELGQNTPAGGADSPPQDSITVKGELDHEGFYKTEWEEEPSGAWNDSTSTRVEVVVTKKRLEGPNLSIGEVDEDSEDDGGWTSEGEEEESAPKELKRLPDVIDIGAISSGSSGSDGVDGDSVEDEADEVQVVDGGRRGPT